MITLFSCLCRALPTSRKPCHGRELGEGSILPTCLAKRSGVQARAGSRRLAQRAPGTGVSLTIHCMKPLVASLLLVAMPFVTCCMDYDIVSWLVWKWPNRGILHSIIEGSMSKSMSKSACSAMSGHFGRETNRPRSASEWSYVRCV